MARWLRLCSTDSCPPGEARELLIEDRLIALFNVDGRFYALDGICPHQGGSLGKGKLTGCIITCPWHGWQFDVTTGRHEANRSLIQPGFAVKVEGEDVMVEVDA
jgi:nitrite reductase/ring-hydroxylating ferredoxin subunit